MAKSPGANQTSNRKATKSSWKAYFPVVYTQSAAIAFNPAKYL
ncbi:MAG: hypothetical protein V7K57_07770 [Nostoc sp.]